jgi:hypothetical protein
MGGKTLAGEKSNYSTTPLIRNYEPSGYEESPDNWTFL